MIKGTILAAALALGLTSAASAASYYELPGEVGHFQAGDEGYDHVRAGWTEFTTTLEGRDVIDDEIVVNGWIFYPANTGTLEVYFEFNGTLENVDTEYEASVGDWSADQYTEVGYVSSTMAGGFWIIPDFDPVMGSIVKLSIMSATSNSVANTDGIVYTNGWLPTEMLPTPVPVPATVWLFGTALAGLGFLRKRKTSEI